MSTDGFDLQSEPSVALGGYILIVDDDQRAAKALSLVLAQAGFRSAVFHNGGDAIRNMDHQKISAALVDVHLPDLNGLVLVRQLRDRLGADVPIFVVSGDTSMATLNSLPHVGATYFFAKPMSAGFVVEQLRKHLAEA